MSNLTFLPREQYQKSDILKKRGTQATMTDFSILLGGWVKRRTQEISEGHYYVFLDDDDILEGGNGPYWTSLNDGKDAAFTISHSGKDGGTSIFDFDLGARPVLPFSSISRISTNGEIGAPKRASDGVLEVEYGYYPQKAVSKDMQERLERAFQRESLSRTGNKYTTDSRRDNYDTNKKFSPQQHEEFQLDGKRYIRVKANFLFKNNKYKLSNGEIYRDGDIVWVEVAPVKWLVDEKAKIMLTEKLIFSGVQFKSIKDDLTTEDFDITNIKKFMDRFLSKELEQPRGKIKADEQIVEEWLKEYAIPNKIHPAVIGYILSKYNNSGRSEVLQDIEYFFKEPENRKKHLDANGCKDKKDHCSWTSISKDLYKFETNLESGRYAGKEDIILRSIASKLRIEWANEFLEFYNLTTLTPEKIVQGMGKEDTSANVPQYASEGFAYMAALITADESQVEACREFIRKHCPPECLSIYDIYWAGNDKKKMEKIAELKKQEISLHTGDEAGKYAQDGLDSYNDIAQMYSDYRRGTNKERSDADGDKS